MSMIRDFTYPMVDLNGQTVLLTGGTGSFGRAFTRHALKKFKLKKLIIFSRDELKQYEMAQTFPESTYPEMRYFIGDVRDAERLEMAMRQVDVVIHAAAMKHVPAAEYNPVECIKTNVHGAENVVKASMRANVKKVIALSTDKAANPINLYGASKLASDKIFAAANNISGDGPRFAVVRYGNVIGSSGSIVPLYRKLISQGADALPVTDDRMTRFWITIEQGVDFVLSSLALMQGGEVFIPKIPSTKISDLCRVMAPDLPIKIIGIRPGEKLHEVMITDDDARNTLELDDRYIIKPCFAFWTDKPYEQIGATTVAGTFRYASDSNPEWLNDENLSALIARTNV